MTPDPAEVARLAAEWLTDPDAMTAEDAAAVSDLLALDVEEVEP